MLQQQTTRSVPSVTDVMLDIARTQADMLSVTSLRHSGVTSSLTPMPEHLEYMVWIIVMWESDDAPVYVKDTHSKVLTDVPTGAARFREFSLVEQELGYWHDRDRPGYKPFHRYATFALLDPVSGEVTGHHFLNATSAYDTSSH